MKKICFIFVAICSAYLLLLSGCSNDGDGKLEMKEPRKELNELPQGKNWFEMDISDPEKFNQQMNESE
ncbi:hypothetical protein [Nitrosomonas sp.]|uniref:hypothetical protein n=1 Tax=Nitrosomonas sp. TaxID=42353 RepID=UPI0026210B2B|nr:hypothetical protein [Nitrosomonas sp.]MCW5599998.1 hypothetical protein [Nitrosomonas sp.]